MNGGTNKRQLRDLKGIRIGTKLSANEIDDTLVKDHYYQSLRRNAEKPLFLGKTLILYGAPTKSFWYLLWTAKGKFYFRISLAQNET